MRDSATDLQNHVIVCGYGRVGRNIVEHFVTERVPFAIVDLNKDLLNEYDGVRFPAIVGDATRDDVLERAGIRRARALISVLDDDSQNVFVTLSAKVLNPDLLIIVRASTPKTEYKLRLAGADHIISPFSIASHRMADIISRPNVVNFLDSLKITAGAEFVVEQIELQPGSALIGQRFIDANIRIQTGATVISVLHGDGRRIVIPEPQLLLDGGDILISIGNRRQLRALKELSNPSSVVPY